MTSKYIGYVANLCSLMILARVFDPEDFGTVASLAVIYTFFMLFIEGGFSPSFVALKSINREVSGAVISILIMVGFISAIVLYTSIDSLAKFYNNEKVSIIGIFTCISLFLSSLNVVPYSILLREQNFGFIAIGVLLSEAISTAFVINLINILDPLICLAMKIPVFIFSSVILNTYFCSKTSTGSPTPNFKFSIVGPIFSMSKFQFGFNFLNYFSRNLDNVLVAKFIGANGLGIYDQSYRLMRYPIMLLSGAMTPAIIPSLREFAEMPLALEKIHWRFSMNILSVSVLFSSFIQLFSSEIVYVILGSKWEMVTPLIQLLAISIPAQMLIATSGSFFQLTGKMSVFLRNGLYTFVTVISAILIGISYRSLAILCSLIVIAYTVVFFQTYFLMYRYIFHQSLFRFKVQFIIILSFTILSFCLHFIYL